MDIETGEQKKSESMLNANSSRRNLVFAGGGVKGVAYIGVSAALEACGFPFDKLERVGGTSAGSLAALAFALGFDSTRINDMLGGLDFMKLLDDEHSAVSSRALMEAIEPKETDLRFFRTVRETKVAASAMAEMKINLGCYPGEYAREWIESIIFNETKIKDCTFKDLRSLRESTHPNYKDLYVVGCFLNRGLAYTFSADTTPNDVISDAIRVSMSIPGIYEPHCPYHKVNGERVQRVDQVNQSLVKERWVDGGLLENYPVNLFDEARYAPELVNVKLGAPFINLETLGFNFTDDAAESHSVSVPEINTPIEFFWAVSSMLYNHERNEDVRRKEELRTININCNGVQAFDFNLTVSQKQMLAQNAWHSVLNAYGEDKPIPELLVFKEQEQEVKVLPRDQVEHKNCCVMS